MIATSGDTAVLFCKKSDAKSVLLLIVLSLKMDSLIVLTTAP